LSTNNGGKWHKNSHQGYIAWNQFVVIFYEHFDIDTHHLGHLTKLKQSGTIEDYIIAFEQLAFYTKGMLDTFFHECFISGLKDDIHAHVLMAHPKTWLEATHRAKEAQQVVTTQIKNPSFIPHPTHHSHSSLSSSQGPQINKGRNG
jgi:hypothetical protein